MITSDISWHINIDQPDHSIDLEKENILAVDLSWFERGVKEAIHISVSRPLLNRDGGRYHLPAMTL